VILDRILEARRDEIERIRARRAVLERAASRAAEADPPRGFRRALEGREVAVIAEFKRRSPSAGRLGTDEGPGTVAGRYAAAGASALSILTDGPHFGGDLADLRAARGAAGLPALRKDFLVEEAQLLEARAAGADAVLLIVRILEQERLRALLSLSAELGMDALVEAHDGEELARALAAGAEVIGINARDLDTFEIDLARAERLVAEIPADRVAVAESGVEGRADVRRLAAVGADAVLVGGWLMRRGPDAVAELEGVPKSGRPRSKAARGSAKTPRGSGVSGGEDGREDGRGAPPHPDREGRAPAVKICGLRRPADVEAAAGAGARYAGLVLAESPRRVAPGEAARLARLARSRGLEPVGVFVDAGTDRVGDLAERLELAVVQLHGGEPPEACRDLRARGVRVWKALRPRSREELGEGIERYRGHVDALLVEGWSPGRAGGTGSAFPHRWLRERDPGRGGAAPGAARLVLAGGLTPENVAEAARRVRPDVVDVSSGVERAPGVKDPARIRAFVRAARQAFRESVSAGEGADARPGPGRGEGADPPEGAARERSVERGATESGSTGDRTRGEA